MNSSRKLVIPAVIVLIAVIYLIKLFSIQVVDERYALAATDNVVQRVVEYPYRGLIYDRNGKLMVYNTPEFDLTVVPNDVQDLDTALFCKIFNITTEEFVEKMAVAKKYSWRKPSIFIRQLSNVDLAKSEDYLVDFKGFNIQSRTTRAYTEPIMANALGYVSEISKRKLESDTSSYYQQGDYIGQSGIELYYENQLRGKRGVKFKKKNVHGVDMGPYDDGNLDIPSEPGQNLYSTIDIDLQKYGEMLLEGKSGSIVAIEPATGEVLAIVSGPSYDPNLLTGRNYSENFSAISQDTMKPLFNRPLMAQYRPGSIFKIMQALVALQEGVITPSTRIACNRSIIGCHGPHSYEDLVGAITHSCNPYFYNVMKRVVNREISKDPFEDTRIGLEKWHTHIESFGLGDKLGIDLPNEKTGMVPSVAYYDRAYNNRPWKYSNIYSIAIGEGENLVVPLQMANFAAIMANRGFYYTPHLVRSVGESGKPLEAFQEKHFTTVDPQYFEVAVEAMANVVESGTGQYRAKLRDVVVCGKTGTVQNDPLPDHSVFIAFAPRENPQIALSVYVEDAGQGARAAAAIASLMIEKYLLGQTQRPNIEAYVKKGEFL
ncbi:penicillin-binding protein 2 [Fulvivirga sedimenti]|uniref:Penicillin-binding protein 2 n=1 Tax=Fulvivirga sedimenti TaxID=2879465 RepID=A0A9X1HLJ2_9BACT|nr:penicillin-binding protein 2 [Fulvivirga sedimenti]MCA6074220.1 penicillin-binding protein 2 [Fulvivirga sedimenti]